MASYLSPGVYVKETDLTLTTPGVATSVGAIAGEFIWGPVNDLTLISNEATLVTRFGKPTNTTYKSFFSAKNFLDYSTSLQVIRVSTAGQLNAVSTGTAIKVGNESTYTTSFANGEASVGMFAAKYPGELGNSLKVSIADADTFSRTLTGTVATTANSATVTGTGTTFTTTVAVGSYITVTSGSTSITKQVLGVTSDTQLIVTSAFETTLSGATVVCKWEYYSQFDAAPIDSNRAVALSATKDGLHAVVVDEDGKFSGTPGTVLERFENMSKANDALSFNGSSAYYKTVLNTSSYIWWMDHPDAGDLTSVVGTLDFGAAVAQLAVYKSLKKAFSVSLTSGADGSAATTGEYQLALDVFKPVDTVDINLLITGGANKDVQRYAIQNIAEVRQDVVAFTSPYDISTNNPIIGDTSESLEKIIAWYNSVNVSSSFGVADSGYKYQYDKYNDVYRWVPLNGDVAGACARTDSVAETWYSPAGLSRGQLKNVTRLAYNPDKSARDELFKRNINPVVAFPGEGTVLFGDKTMTRRPSAFDAINVRRLFIYLEKAIAQASKYYLFEQNTELTRQLFASTINPLLRDIKGRQGITDFYVDIGDTVNTPDTIDAGELRANIFIKPVRSIRFIALNFVATKTSANFTTIEL